MDIKLFIEQVVAEELEAASGVAGGEKEVFSTAALEAQPTVKAKIRYLRTILAPQKGIEGSFRIVFYLDSQRVIKVEKDTEEVIENQEEIDASACLGSYAAQVLDHAPDGRWLIAQRAEEVGTYQDFADHLMDYLGERVTDKNFLKALEYKVYKVGGFLPWAVDQMEKDSTISVNLANRLWNQSDWFRGLVEVLTKCNINPADFRLENWGLLNGKLVIIDYGYGKL